jgi:amino acid adenylation domain-containing protein/non-ribosomal peptide synthase protein (TIGR01720 family)
MIRSILIGESPMVTACARRLLERGHTVVALVSADRAVADWALARQIPLLEPVADLAAHFSRGAFDCLFSVVNPRILKAETLALPSRWAINYHDGPLPRYAGVHATSWALIDGAKTHGVTWHRIAPGIDDGDILEQETFGVDPAETAFTLNVKCVEAGLRSFDRLIEKMSASAVEARSQDLRARTYFALHQRPPLAAVLDFTRPARELEALVRALDFGGSRNALGVPKILRGGSVLAVTTARASDEPPSAPPGTVLSVGPARIAVATGAGRLDLVAFAALDGVALSPTEAAERLALTTGARMDPFPPRDLFEQLEPAIARAEAHWVSVLRSTSLPDLPWTRRAGTPSDLRRRAPIEIPPSLPQSLLPAAFAAWVARVSGSREVDLGYSHGALLADIRGLEPLLSTRVPVRFEIDLARPLREVTSTIDQARRKQTFLRDVGLRYPALASHPIELPIAIDEEESPPGPALALVAEAKALAWDAALISDTAAAAIREQLETWFASLAADPDRPLARAQMVSPRERRRVLVEWNDTHRDRERTSIVDRVEAHARTAPDRDAVIHGVTKLSYAELDRRANKLAHRLRALGVGPGSRVVFATTRSPAMIAGILGIMKSGAAYVAVDPALPPERLAFLLADAAPHAVVSEASIADQIPPHDLANVRLDPAWSTLAAEPSEAPEVPLRDAGAAYVIYTSGSTGAPKGVVVPHDGLTNLLSWAIAYYDLRPGDRAAQLASFSYDASVLEVGPALFAGATLVIGDDEVRCTPQALVAWLAEQRIQHAFLATALAEAVLSERWPDDFPLRTLLTGGDALHTASGKRPPFRFSNAYGPTECTVMVSAADVVAGAADAPPIGRPIANTELYLLDRDLEPVPIGAAGELCVGGDSLAFGYLHRPDLTAERFVPNPFSREGGARMYRTGDLARYREDGSVEFLGRLDHQVKIRGHRIELGEIEATLLLDAGVKEAVVVAREDRSVKRLVAYVARASADKAEPAALQAFLRTRLPEHMVPSAIVALDELPKSSSGKIARDKLPAPVFDAAREIAAPRNSIEERLVAIWRDVLKVPNVGVHDSFLSLGGDSILSIRILSLAEQAGITLTHKQFFQHPTIAEQATIAQSVARTGALPSRREGPSPLAPAQRYLFTLGLSELGRFNQALELEAKKRIDPAQLEQAIVALLDRHEALRLRFSERGQEAGPLPPPPFLERDAIPPDACFDLSSGPMIRFALTAPDQLHIVAHHLAVDAVSWSVILSDLELALGQLETRQPLALPPAGTSFLRWAAELEEEVQKGAFDAEIEQASDRSRLEAPRLPMDRQPPAAVRTGTARELRVKLGAGDTASILRNLPRARRAQALDALLVALVDGFAGWTGERALLVDLEGHGREDLVPGASLSRTVGWFTSVAPLRIDLRRSRGDGESIAAARAQREALTNRGASFFALRHLRRDLLERWSTLPKPEISVNYLGRFDEAIAESALFRWKPASIGPYQHPGDRREHLIDVEAAVSGDELLLSFRWSPEVHEESAIRRVAERTIDALSRISRDVEGAAQGGPATTDFPAARLSQRELERLLSGRSRR